MDLLRQVEGVVGRLGFEPRTCGLRARCAASCASDPGGKGNSALLGYVGAWSKRPSPDAGRRDAAFAPARITPDQF